MGGLAPAAPAAAPAAPAAAAAVAAALSCSCGGGVVGVNRRPFPVMTSLKAHVARRSSFNSSRRRRASNSVCT